IKYGTPNSIAPGPKSSLGKIHSVASANTSKSPFLLKKTRARCKASLSVSLFVFVSFGEVMELGNKPPRTDPPTTPPATSPLCFKDFGRLTEPCSPSPATRIPPIQWHTCRLLPIGRVYMHSYIHKAQ